MSTEKHDSITITFTSREDPGLSADELRDLLRPLVEAQGYETAVWGETWRREAAMAEARRTAAEPCLGEIVGRWAGNYGAAPIAAWMLRVPEEGYAPEWLVEYCHLWAAVMGMPVREFCVLGAEHLERNDRARPSRS